MKAYILQEKQKFNGFLELKGFKIKNDACFIQDNVDTIRELKLKNDPKIYYLLSFEREKQMPNSIVGKYSKVGQNPNKILTADEMLFYLSEKEDIPIEILI